MTRKEKYRQICREARATGLILLALIVLWCCFGFGGFALTGAEPLLFGLPLWALAGTLGLWLTAIVLVWGLTHFVFRDMPLEDSEALTPTTAPGSPPPPRGRTKAEGRED